MIKQDIRHPKPRSRLGCNACKRIKQKCDELKPGCTRCGKRGTECVYSFEMVFQNQSLAQSNSSIRIRDHILNESKEKKTQRIALIKSTQLDLYKPDFSVPATHLMKAERTFEKNDISEPSKINQYDASKFPYNMPSFIPLTTEPILPLPENLIEHEYFKEAFEFFTHFTGHFTVAATPQIYTSNPMCTIIPKMACENYCLLDVLISHALTHRSVVMTDENFSPHLVELLISRGMYRLVSAMKNNEGLNSEVACVTALYMCVQKIFSGHDNSRYKQLIDLARNSFEEYVKSDKTIGISKQGRYVLKEEEQNFHFFLLCWIGYFEIIGMMMAISPSDYKMPQRSSSLFELYELKRRSKIDLFLGFDVSFLPIFDKLVSIVNLLEDREASNTVLPTDILTKAVEWEHEFNGAYTEFKSIKGDEDDLSANNEFLIASNDAFYYAGLLHLYRRVYNLKRASAIVQRMVRKIYQIFKNIIESGSSAENCAIFPLFIAACESITIEHQTFFFDRFQVQFLGGNFPAGDVLSILTDTWDTGECWVNSVRRIKKENGFFLI